MWFLPVLVIGALVVAAARSPREASSSRQLPPPAMSGPLMFPEPPMKPPPGPIAVLGEILRIGKYPPPKVILCAIAEAELLGRQDLVTDIMNMFVAPVVQQFQLMSARNTWMPQTSPWVPQAPVYERGSCSVRSPRAQADAWMPQASCSPRAQADAWMPQPPRAPRSQANYAYAPYTSSSYAPQHDRGSYASRASCGPQYACAPRASSVVAPAASSTEAPAALTARQPSEDEILGMLHADPKAFLDMVAAQQPRRGPLVEVFPVGSLPPTLAAEPRPTVVSPDSVVQSLVPVTPSTTANADALAEQLLQVRGHVGSGVVLVNPSTGAEVFEVQWLRGYPIPPLPQVIDGRPVNVVIVDSPPQLQPAGLPPETVAQMQETAGLPEAADQTRALAPGSPIAGVSDDAWRQFVMRLERESPTFSSGRSVGQYRQRRERLADLEIDPRSIYGSAAAQRVALDADLADAYNHAVQGGLVTEHLGRSIALPGQDENVHITLSGLLGVIQCAGLDGATGWLERPNDRKRYPNTTQVFLNTNGVF